MTTIKLRRGTAAQWASANPVLSTGEPGYEGDTGHIKVGDGVTHYVDLPAFAPGASYTDEMAQDAVATAIANGAAASAAGGITATYDDTANAISLTLALAYAGEVAQDAVAAMIAAGTLTGITATYDDANNKMSFAVAATAQKFRGEWAATNFVTTFSDDGSDGTLAPFTSQPASGAANASVVAYATAGVPGPPTKMFQIPFGGSYNQESTMSLDTSSVAPGTTRARFWIKMPGGAGTGKFRFYNGSSQVNADTILSTLGWTQYTFDYTAGATIKWAYLLPTGGSLDNLYVAKVELLTGDFSNPYLTGQYVMYSGIMYRSVVDNNVSTPGADGNWVIVPIASAYGDENARDAVGAAMRGGTGVSIVVDDPNDTITVKVSQTFRGEWAADTIAFTDSFTSAPANPPYTTGGSTSYSGSGGPNGTYPTYFNVGGGFNTGGSLSMDTSQIPALAGKTISKISFWSQTYSYTDSTAGSLFSANGTSKATFPYTGAGNTSGWTDNTITIGLVNPVLLWFANKVNIRVAGVRVYVTADPYMLGHVVMYSGVMYRSVIDNNASVPGADGNWVIVPITGSFRYRGAFAAGTTYNIGEVVSLGNRLYHCYANGTTAAPAPVGSNYKTRFANGVPADSLWAYSGGSTHFTQLGTNNVTYGADLEGAQTALAIRGLGSASSVQYAELTLTFTSAGTIKFADVVSSEATNDVGMFSIDGASQHTSSGNANSWTARSYAVASGTHTFRWTYTKNGSVDTGFDAYMVTNIKTTNSSVSLNGWTQIGYTSISQQDIQDFDGDMHVIGASGEPAFQNSWAQSTVSVSNFEPVGFWKRADGRVELKGVVSGGSANTTVFTLPAGFRPAKNRVLPCVAIGGTWGAGACLVNTDGTVNLVVIGTGGGAATSMDGVSFLAEQ